MENLDQLFRGKLENHSLAPSQQAWGKLESQLTKKNKVVVAWRLAAAIAIGGLLTAIILLTLPSEPMQQQAQQQPEVKPAEILTPSKKELVAEVPAARQHVEKKSKVQPVKTEVKIEEVKKSETPEQPIVTETHLDVTVTHAQPEVALTAAEKPMVIEFVLEELPEANSETEKETGLKKMWETVKEIKNGERSLDLKQATYDLFASGERKAKDTKNN